MRLGKRRPAGSERQQLLRISAYQTLDGKGRIKGRSIVFKAVFHQRQVMLPAHPPAYLFDPCL